MSAGRGASVGPGGWETDDAAAYIHCSLVVSNHKIILCCPSDAFQQQSTGTLHLFTHIKHQRWVSELQGQRDWAFPALPQPKVGRLLGELPAEAEPCRREDGAGGCRHPQLPASLGILAQGRDQPPPRQLFGGAAVPTRCQRPRAALAAAPRCLPAGLAVTAGREGAGRGRDGAEAGWRGGGAAKARSSEGRKHSAGVRRRRAGREGMGMVVLVLGGTWAQHGAAVGWGQAGQGCRAWQARTKLPFLLCLKPEPCLVPPLLLLPEG